MKRFTILIAAAVMLLAILLQPVRLWGQSTTYTSNVTLTTTGGSNASECSVSINSSSYSAIKIGTSKASGYAYITVPAGTVTLHVHCAAWNGDAASLSVSTTASGVTITPTSWSLTADSGISGSGSSFTINASNASTSYYKSFTLTGVTSATQIKLQSANKKRAVFWGVNAVVAHTLNYSATNGSISGVDAGSNAVASGASIAEGATVTLTATPDTGYSFTGWSVSGTGSTLSSTSENPTTFTMGTANATVTANFLVASGYITVSPPTATPTCAAEDVVFSIDTDQTLDDNPVVFYTTSTGDETTEKPAWIGDILYDEGELLVEVNANTGAARTAYFRVEEGSVKSDVITINQAVYAPAAPIIPATTSFDYTMNVTMSQEAGKTIYYTTDGSTPDNTSTEYIGAFDINATTTVKAIAYDGTYPSAVVSATYTRTYKYINEITAAGNYTVKGTVVAVYGTTGFVLGDGTGYIYDYKSSHGLSVGNKVSITSGTIKAYNHVWEFDGATPATVSISSYTTGTPAITTLTSSIISSYSSTTNLSTYFEVVGPYSNTNKEITVSGSSIPVRLSTTTDYSSLNGKTVKAKGYFLGFNKDTDYFYLCPESVEAVPVVTTSVSSISDFNYNVGGGPDVKSFSITGANLTDNVTVTASTNYKVCKTENGTYENSISYEPTDGALEETTVYVRLESGLSSNTYEGTVTVASTGATSKEIALTGKVKQTITISGSIENGSVNATISAATVNAAVAGETVTITATADDGYKFSTFSVKDADEGDVSLSPDATTNPATFTMPSKNVTVSATFVEAYSVTYDDNGATGGTVPVDENSPYVPNATVTVLDNTGNLVKTGYTFSGWNTAANGSGTPYSDAETFSITESTTLYAQWTAASYNVALSLVANVDLLASYDDNKTIDEGENADVAYGTEITLSATGMDAGKVFIWSVTNTSTSVDVTDDVLDGDVLTVPAYNITIGGQIAELFFKYSGDISEGDYIITYTTGGGVTYAMKNTISSSRLGYQTLTPSDNQIISEDASDYLWHIAPSAYYDGYWTIYNSDESKYAASNGTDKQAALLTSAQIANEDKAAWSIDGTSSYEFINKYKNDASSTYKYLRNNTTSGFAIYTTGTMGANTLYKKAIGSKHSVAIAIGITNGSVSVSPSSAYEGQTVTLTPEPSDGYMLDSWDVYKTGDASTKITVKNNAFVMPGYDVTVSATFRVQHTYTLVDGSTVTLVPGKHYIIASTNSTNYYVMGAQNGSVRNSVPATLSDSKILEHADFYEVVISGSGTSAEPYTMYSVRDEGYMYSTGASKANIGTREDNVTTNPTYGQWTISISSGTATITSKAESGYTDLEYNHNGGSNPRFACYSSGQTAVKLYVRDGDKDFEFHSPTTIASATIAADETYIVEKDQKLTITTLTNKGDENNLIIEDGGQLITSSTGVQATVKKEIHAATARAATYWYAISSAVANPIISSATNLTTGTYDLYRYNEAATATNAQGQILYWENYKASHDDFTTFVPGRGYLYRNASNLSIAMTGEINVADFKYSVTNTDGPLAGFNLIGNPYSHDIYKGDGTAIPNGTDFLRTGFYYMDPDNGSWTPGTDNSIAIKPNEGILVQTDKDGDIAMTNTTANAAKYNNDNIMFKVANSQYSDETYAWFDKGRGLNKISHRNAEVPMIYINQDGEDYAIATMSDDTKMFSLNFKAMTMGKYTLSYKTKGEFNYLHVIDRFTGEDVDMLLEGEYSFVASPSDSDARFIVKLAYLPDYSDGEGDIFAYQNGSDIFVSGEGELQIFDVMGRFVMSERINGVKTISADELSKGVYVLRLVGNGMKTQKIVVK